MKERESIQYLRERDLDLFSVYNNLKQELGLRAKYLGKGRLADMARKSTAKRVYISYEQAIKICQKIIVEKEEKTNVLPKKRSTSIRMYAHLASSIKELMQSGHTLEQSVCITIDRQAPEFYISRTRAERIIRALEH